jgi:hypothetical protein
MRVKKIDIQARSTNVGEWYFDESPEQLVAERTSDGFRALIPGGVLLRLAASGAPCPLLTNLRVRLRADAAPNLDLGVATDRGWYLGGIPGSSVPTQLEWRGTIATLQQFERLRDGGTVSLTLECHAEVCLLVTSGNGPRLRGEPEVVYGTTHVTYPKETWVRMISQVNAMANVLVEFPLRPSPPSPWDDVWRAVSEAGEHLKNGGTTGWKGCVTAVRLALEKWQGIEKEDMGAGWTSPSSNDRQARSMKQRLDNVRWHLLQVAHFAPHSHADEWERDQAVLLLGALAGLLAVRKP